MQWEKCRSIHLQMVDVQLKCLIVEFFKKSVCLEISPVKLEFIDVQVDSN